MYSNNLIVLLNLLKGYSSEIETIVTDDDNNEKVFGNEFISDLIENIMIDLKDLDRNLS
jgi:hypothetical protein